MNNLARDFCDKKELGVEYNLNKFVPPTSLKFWIFIKSSNGFYSFGNTVSLADVCLIPQVYNAIRFGVDMDMFPKIFSVYNHCLEKDSCKKSHVKREK